MLTPLFGPDSDANGLSFLQPFWIISKEMKDIPLKVLLFWTKDADASTEVIATLLLIYMLDWN